MVFYLYYLKPRRLRAAAQAALVSLLGTLDSSLPPHTLFYRLLHCTWHVDFTAPQHRALKERLSLQVPRQCSATGRTATLASHAP